MLETTKIKNKTELVPCIYDCMFKSIMLDPETQDFLIGHIQMITKIPYNVIKNNMKVENAEYIIENKNDKNIKSDIVVSIGKKFINVEMNRKYYPGVFNKNNAYLHKIASTSYNKSENYSDDVCIIQINFDNFSKFKNKKEVHKFLMQEEYTHEKLDENYINYHIDLSYIYKKCYNKPVEELSKFERYCLMLRAKTRKFAGKIAGDDMVMSRVKNKIEVLSKDEKMIGLYNAEIEEEKIRNTLRNQAEEKGYKSGMRKGLKEGKIQGKLEGKLEGIKEGIEQNKIEIAKNMLKENIDISVISKVTGLTVDEI